MGVVRKLIEMIALLSGSVVAGFVIGAIQHFVSFGVWGYGFGKGPLSLAAFEGGIVGAELAVPTGLIAYYFILKAHVTPKEVAMIVSGSLAGGCVVGIGLFWVSAFATPILTIGIAVWVRRRSEGSADLLSKVRG